MNSIKTIFIRLLLGLMLLTGLLAGLFKLIRPVIHTWGAVPSEMALSLPGDKLISDPVLEWDHGITINAPVQDVWPWIAQMGDTRGGFYSYTFIENQAGAITGGEDYDVVYINADRIHPEWQDPQPGEQIIQGMLAISDVEQGEYLLAESVMPEVMEWVWLWYLQPINDQQTSLIVRLAIGLPEEMADDPIMGFMIDMGGFVMENNMMQGIKTRAEGGKELSWIEPLEIAIWLVTLLIGLAAGLRYLLTKKWQFPLFLAVAAVLMLFMLTFVQPPIWQRIAMTALVIFGVVWDWRRAKTVED